MRYLFISGSSFAIFSVVMNGGLLTIKSNNFEFRSALSPAFKAFATSIVASDFKVAFITVT